MFLINDWECAFAQVITKLPNNIHIILQSNCNIYIYYMYIVQLNKSTIYIFLMFYVLSEFLFVFFKTNQMITYICAEVKEVTAYL